MKPVDQTLFGFTEGNCFAACLASIFELPLEKVPNFCAKLDEWPENFYGWLRDRGLCFLELNYVDWVLPYLPPGAWCLASGPSPRTKITLAGTMLHTVVWKDGKIIHDPHPSHSGLLSVLMIAYFAMLDPSSLANMKVNC